MLPPISSLSKKISKPSTTKRPPAIKKPTAVPPSKAKTPFAVVARAKASAPHLSYKHSEKIFSDLRNGTFEESALGKRTRVSHKSRPIKKPAPPKPPRKLRGKTLDLAKMGIIPAAPVRSKKKPPKSPKKASPSKKKKKPHKRQVSPRKAKSQATSSIKQIYRRL